MASDAGAMRIRELHDALLRLVLHDEYMIEMGTLHHFEEIERAMDVLNQNWRRWIPPEEH